MNWKEAGLRTALRPYNALNAIRYPRQKELLDGLRQDPYALVVFDALRYDIAQRLLPLYLKGNLIPVWSAAHDTFQYGHRCWGDREYPGTYVSGATPLHADPEFDESFYTNLYNGWNPGDTLPNLVEAFRECWDVSLGTVDPDALTDVARDYTDREKLVVHYFQPHAPYIGRCSLLGHTDNASAEVLSGDAVDKPIWERYKAGEIDQATLERAYITNAMRAIEAALPLLREVCNQNRRVVIMADHGELLGRMHRRLVSHPRLSLPQIRRVPWMEVHDVRDYPDPDRHVDGDTAEKLRALGYR